ncbi:MAG: UDP-N-acetylmuramoyl-tripeptide--D-alanyl-D-alanine ligase [Chloroflexota bacterium]|nr:UDP-N-acetylmuramoyl-tripeptide--D-alanyl-D-alanine ligase [Chloroflexota bacterium]
MTAWSLADVLAGTGGTLRGELHPETTFPRLQRDSRTVEAGDLFIAIRGEQHDGHDFVAGAAVRGGAAAIVAERWAAEHADAGLPLIVVDEPITALQRWAAWRRKRLNVRVVGVTGSVGKTSAKEAIAAVLAQRFRVYRSPGNYNNEIGLPLSLLEAPDDSEVLVLEMGGAYAFGELTLLASIAQPTVGVVTNVYPVHLERMGSIEAIARTKAELVEALPADGIAVLNGDDARVRAMATGVRGRVITYGLDQSNDIRADSVTTEGLEGTTFWVTIEGDRLYLKVPFVGAHGVLIALVAIAVGHSFGMHISEMLVGLKDPSVQVRLLFVPGPRGAQLIDDTYNASTPSVLSALALLSDLRGRGRRVAVLGDMRELGPVAEEEHRVVGRRAGEVADLLVTYGEMARLIATEAQAMPRPDDAPLQVRSFQLDERRPLVDFLQGELGNGDIVLLKGSRGLQMEQFVAALRADADTEQTDLGETPTTVDEA